MANTDPLNIAAADRIGERIERVADQCENMLDPNLLEHANQDIRDRLGHRCLLKNRGLLSRTKSISDVSNGNPSTSGSNRWLKLLGRHPIGATGGVLTTKLIHPMRQDGLTRGLVTLCIGGGQGIALAIEVLH